MTEHGIWYMQSTYVTNIMTNRTGFFIKCIRAWNINSYSWWPCVIDISITITTNSIMRNHTAFSHMYIKTGMYDVLISLPTALRIESVCSLTELFFVSPLPLLLSEFHDT